MQFHAAGARRANKCDGESLVVCHRDRSRLAVSRKTFDPNLLRVDGLVGLEVIESAARAPGPRAKCAPVVDLAWLALVAKADDSARQPAAVVGLNAVRANDRVPPALCKHLLLPARSALADEFARWTFPAKAKSKLHDH